MFRSEMSTKSALGAMLLDQSLGSVCEAQRQAVFVAADADESELQTKRTQRLHTHGEVFVVRVIDLADGRLDSVNFTRYFNQCAPKFALLAV